MARSLKASSKLRKTLGELLEVAKQIPNPKQLKIVVSYDTDISNYDYQPDGSLNTAFGSYVKKKDRSPI